MSARTDAALTFGRRLGGEVGRDGMQRTVVVHPLWDDGSAAAHQSLAQTVRHPVVEEVTIDVDTLTVPDSDLRIIV